MRHDHWKCKYTASDGDTGLLSPDRCKVHKQFSLCVQRDYLSDICDSSHVIISDDVVDACSSVDRVNYHSFNIYNVYLFFMAVDAGKLFNADEEPYGE